MLLSLLQIIVLVAVTFAADEYENRPRGVSPRQAALYEERSEFECLDGSKKIPFEQVNDDYCDCQDGSDEPGTSACSNGHFYCRNVGYRPLTIPSSHVNDFICDCCDGSDEWDSGVQCPNLCTTQGEKAREEAKQQRMVQEAGYAKRLELAKSGSKSLEEKKTEVEKQNKELDELEPLKSSAEERKNAAEEREREAKDRHENAWKEIKEERLNELARDLFMKLDLDKDEKFSFEEFRKFKHQFIEPEKEKKDDEGVEEPEAAEAQGIVKEIFGDLQELDFIGFRNIFDKVKKFAAKLKPAVNDSKSEDQQQPQKSEDQASTTATSTPPKEEGQKEEAQLDSENAAEEDDHDLKDEPEEDEPEAGEGEEEENEDKDKPPYDEVTQAAINEGNMARQEYDEIQRKVTDLESNIRTSESFLEFQYGADHAWAPYKDECAELTTTQYTYKLCLFDRSVQKDRNGHSEISLGHWSAWDGPEENKYGAQKYDKGQSCWNGPERSTHVVVECGEELQLVEASEPSKCEYRFVLKSPAACANPAEAEHSEHSEL